MTDIVPNISRLRPDAKLPDYATSGAACFDLYTTDAGTVSESSPIVLGTGIAVKVPEGHVMLVFSRSGNGFKNDVRLSNCVGVIDSDYTGEIKVKLACDNPFGSYQVNVGDRIAQAMIIPCPRVTFVEVDELPSTDRGANGFGSTGA